MALTVPEGAPTKTIVYTDLLGVDFSQDASLVDRQHSPDMLNMISDEGGSPVKRKGWEVLIDLSALGYPGATIEGIWHFQANTLDYYLVGFLYSGVRRIAQYDPDARTISSEQTGVTDFYDAFFMNDSFYVVTSGGLWRCKPNENNESQLDIAQVTDYKVPLVIIQRDPANGGGTSYDNINLLTSRRTEQFQDRPGTATSFLLTVTTKSASIVPTNIVFEYLASDGITWTQDNTATYTRTQQGNIYTFKVNITTAHAWPSGLATGDNIRITYTFGESQASKVLDCTNHAFFSHGALDQVFMTGNNKYPNYVWYSDYGDPTYFPDLNYMVIGSAGTRCMGFLNVGENLAVIKESDEDDSSIYFIYETSLTTKTVSTNTANGSESETTQEYAYAVKRSASGVGAVSRRCFKTLQDEPLFLSENGVQGIMSTNTTFEKVVRNRSRHVDRKLLAEEHLEKAISCVYNGYYCIFINDHVYILDSRHTAADRRGNTNYVYEAYYWENVPAKCVSATGKTIYFGTADGKICRFKKTGEMTDYSDGSHYDETQQMQVGGVAIHARYATKNDDDNAPQYFKTMMKKGSMCTVAPYFKSSVDVYIMADGTPATAQELYYDRNHQPVYDDAVPGIYIGTHYSNVDNIFPRIDFSRLLFDTRRSPRDYFFRKKKKKYVRLQITLENRELNEGFGVYSIVKTYTMTRYAK